MIADDLKIKRWKRQIRLIDRVNQIIEERRYSEAPTPVPPKIALPVFHEASLEDNDFLQDMWAKLLIAAMHQHENQKIRTAYIDIIKQLEPQDVSVLRFIYENYIVKKEKKTDMFFDNIEKHLSHKNTSHYKTQKIALSKKMRALTGSPPNNFPSYRSTVIEKVGIDIDEVGYRTSVDNLIRLRLISSYISTQELKTENDSFNVTLHHEYGAVCITYLGIFFIEACVI